MRRFYSNLICVLALCLVCSLAQGNKKTITPPPTTTTPAPTTTAPPVPIAPVPGQYYFQQNGLLADYVFPMGMNDVHGTAFQVNTTTGYVDQIGYWSCIGNTLPKFAQLWGPSCELLANISLPAPADPNTAQWIVGTLPSPVVLQPYVKYIASYQGGDFWQGIEDGLYYGRAIPPHINLLPGAAGLYSSVRYNGVYSTTGGCPTLSNGEDYWNQVRYVVPAN